MTDFRAGSRYHLRKHSETETDEDGQDNSKLFYSIVKGWGTCAARQKVKGRKEGRNSKSICNERTE